MTGQVAGGGGLAGLTTRELEMLRYRAEGLTVPEIAERCFLSRWTVKGHLSNAYRKLALEDVPLKSQRASYLLGHHDGALAERTVRS